MTNQQTRHMTINTADSALLSCLQRLEATELDYLDSLIDREAALTYGEFYVRTISKHGLYFDSPEAFDMQVVAWSRILADREILCAINFNLSVHAVFYVTIDNELHPVNTCMKRLYASGSCPSELNVEVRNGRSVRLSIPPGALVIYG